MLSAWTLIVSTRPHADFKRLVRNDGSVAQNGHGSEPGTGRTSHSNGISPASQYYWQAMPEKLWQRIFWVYDLTLSYRGPHWSWSLRDSNATPMLKLKHTNHHPSFISTFSRWVAFYIVIDVLKAIMLTDPYFLSLGTSISPSWLDQESSILHWSLLRVFRDCLSIFAIWTTMHYFMNLSRLVNYHFVPCGYALGDDSFPELERSLFGPISSVLDHGLAGFWAVFWHQTFRFAFVSNGQWAARLLGFRERSPQARYIVVITAFTLSGFGHAMAVFMEWSNRDQSYLEAAKAFSFFALQIVGVCLQALLFPRTLVKDKKASQVPLNTRYANVAFTLIWLLLTGPLLIDPLARGGTWLFEPIPFSFVRGLGFSRDRRWWCWKSVNWGNWVYDEKRWWLSGYQVA